MGMGPLAYVYTPSGCGGGSECDIHVVYHGCDSSVEAPGKLSIVKYAGYNEWAESNNLVILYPQSLGVSCWDWTGATIPGNSNTAYDTRAGIQTTTVNRIVDHLAAAMRTTAIDRVTERK